MQSEHELPSETYQSVVRLSAEGDESADAKDFETAIAKYNQAWLLIPEPKDNWFASTWILAAIADAAFLGGFTALAREALRDAMTCPGGLGNPFLHLRYGQVMFDIGELDRAADELMRAYMGGGPEIFEEDDPRYLDFLKTRAIL